ncbi:hypothetical protein BDFB_004152, partial [Asbolus verrucosus]
ISSRVMKAEKQDYFQIPLNYYDKLGLRPSCTSYKKYVSIYILYPLLLMLCGLVLFNIRYQNDNIFEMVAVFESLSAFGYIFVRKTIFMVHGSLFEEIIQERSRFWNYDLFGQNTEKEFRKQMGFCVFLIKSLLIGCCTAITIHVFTPIFVEGYVLPDACFIPGDNNFFIIIIYSLEVLFYVETFFMVGIFDGFFLLMCTDLKIQFKILKKTVRSIRIEKNEDKYWIKLKTCCNYHNFLLSNLETRKFVLFWLMKSQVPIPMTGAGIFQLNRSTLLQVIIRKTILIVHRSLFEEMIEELQSKLRSNACHFQFSLF